MTTINPFEKPDPTQSETQEVIGWIQNEIKRGNFTFHYCLMNIEDLIDQKKYKMAKIAA